jgi:hypothetical protein
MSDMHRTDEELEGLIRAELARTQTSAHPDRAIARDLHAAMRSKHERNRPRGLAAIFTMRIPAYQAMLGVAAVALLLVVLRPTVDVPAPVIERTVVHVPVRDTVVVSAAPVAIVSHSAGETDDPPYRRVLPSRSERRSIGRGVLRRDERPRADSRTSLASRTASSHRSRAPKDSAIEKPHVDRPNRLGGLANIQLLAHQRRGVTLVEDTAHRRFTFAVN